MSNNDSGGGCTLFLIDFIGNIFRNRRIKKLNIQARDVETYQNTPVNVLFPPQSYKDNIIISGGNQPDRLDVCEAILRNTNVANHPVIILHTANSGMENMIARNRFGTVVNSKNKLFDAFVGFEFNEIYQAVTDTCKAKYDIKSAGRYVLQVAYDLLINRGRNPYFAGFANCPYFQLSDQIESRLNSGAVTQDIADKLHSLLLTGQSECPKIDTFFSDAKSQIDYLSAPDPKAVGAVSVLSAIKNNQILCIDLKSSGNVMLMELIVNSLIIAMNRGYDFTLMIDDIAFVNNEMLKNTVSQKANHHNIIVSKDLYALTGAKEDVFATLIGEAEKTVLFSHSSNISCDKWSKYIGEYDKIDVSWNTNSGFSQSSKWGFNTNQGQTETMKRESRVKPEHINSLAKREAIVYDHTTGSLIQTVIT
ncbi:MAG: hypothetical protein LBD23_11005 [Oscillospiraceae bacterium]|nr:hypothetical protein [Oscillospiraceae bacterium]